MIDLLLIILSCGAGDYINKAILIGLFIVFVYQVAFRKRILLNAIKSKALWFLTVFGLCFSVAGFGSIGELKRFLVAPILMYLSGWVIAERRDFNQSSNALDETIKRIVLSIVVGYSIHSLINYVVNIGRERWLLIDYYTGSLRAATGLGMINTIAFSMIVYIGLERDLKRKLLASLCFIISVINGLQVGSRTQLLILLVVTVACLLFYFREIDNAKGLKITLISVVSLTFILFFVYKTDFLGIYTKIEGSNLFYRLNADTSRVDGVRVERLVQGVFSLIDHPFGNKSMLYFHNMWLDAGRIAGTLSFLLLAIYSFITYRNALKIVFNKNLELGFRILIFGIYLALFINYSVEPILEGMTEHFYVFCLINGAIDCYYISLIRAKEYKDA
ncbi:MAG: hypothetical protein IKE94_11875 [Aeriscardovia sp.]|nr:hypothetical protein [Aeriscardovia sp.]